MQVFKYTFGFYSRYVSQLSRLDIIQAHNYLCVLTVDIIWIIEDSVRLFFLFTPRFADFSKDLKWILQPYTL